MKIYAKVSYEFKKRFYNRKFYFQRSTQVKQARMNKIEIWLCFTLTVKMNEITANTLASYWS